MDVKSLVCEKPTLLADRYHKAYGEVAPHVVDTTSLRDAVDVRVLQTAQMILISTVSDVLQR